VNKTIVVKIADAIEIRKSRSHYLPKSVYVTNELDVTTGTLDSLANLGSARDSRPALRAAETGRLRKKVNNTTPGHRRGATQQTPSLSEVSNGKAPVGRPDRRWGRCLGGGEALPPQQMPWLPGEKFSSQSVQVFAVVQIN
jgi:hypothetical protein